MEDADVPVHATRDRGIEAGRLQVERRRARLIRARPREIAGDAGRRRIGGGERAGPRHESLGAVQVSPVHEDLGQADHRALVIGCDDERGLEERDALRLVALLERVERAWKIASPFPGSIEVISPHAMGVNAGRVPPPCGTRSHAMSRKRAALQTGPRVTRTTRSKSSRIAGSSRRSSPDARLARYPRGSARMKCPTRQGAAVSLGRTFRRKAA
jgi:hypothetical protein